VEFKRKRGIKVTARILARATERKPLTKRRKMAEEQVTCLEREQAWF
jgi:hypothetical protein